MKKFVKVFKNVLIAFVLISIGFTLGRHSVSRKSIQENNANKSCLVRVYYMHASIRCSMCNGIEKMTEKLLKDKYSKEMSDGEIEFARVNFQENETLSKRFDVLASCVVIAKIRAGKIIAYQRLDKVWTLFRKPAEFNAYISKAIQVYLSSQEESK